MVLFVNPDFHRLLLEWCSTLCILTRGLHCGCIEPHSLNLPLAPERICFVATAQDSLDKPYLEMNSGF